MLTTMIYSNSLSHILLNKLLLNSENYQESDFHAGNDRYLSGILLCINRADIFHQYVFVLL